MLGISFCTLFSHWRICHNIISADNVSYQLKYTTRWKATSALWNIKRWTRRKDKIMTVCSSQIPSGEWATVGTKQHVKRSDSKHQHPCHNATGSPKHKTKKAGTHARVHKHPRLHSAAEMCWANGTGAEPGKTQDRDKHLMQSDTMWPRPQKRTHIITKCTGWNRGGKNNKQTNERCRCKEVVMVDILYLQLLLQG